MSNQYLHVYVAQFVNQQFFNANGNCDIWELTGGNYPFTILEVSIGQMLWDAADNKVPIQIIIGTVTASGSGGGNASVRNVRGSRGAAATVTAEFMNDVEGAGIARYVTKPWHIVDEFIYQPMPDARLTFAASTIAVVHMTAPGYDITAPGMCSTITWVEWK